MIPLAPALDMICDSIDAGRRDGAEKSIVPPLFSVADLAPRIRTGCLFEPQPEGTCGVLVTRQAPRRLQSVQASVRAHWPWFAPSFFLLTGHTTSCTHRRCRHEDVNAAGHRCNVPVERQQLGWEGFVTAYRAELD